MVNFDHVTVINYGYGIKRHILDIFIHEVHNFYNRRLILNKNKDKEKKIFDINNITIANAKNKNNNDMISKDQKFENKIISNKNNEKSNNILGKNNTSLEFNLLDYKPKHFSNKNFTRWILPQQYIDHLNVLPKKSQNVWPCRKEEHNWDENGISITENIDLKEDCYGNNSSYTKSRIIPKFLPNIKNINVDSKYNWLFSSFKSDGRNPFMGGRDMEVG